MWKGITQKGIAPKGITQKGITLTGVTLKGIALKGIMQKGITWKRHNVKKASRKRHWAKSRHTKRHQAVRHPAKDPGFPLYCRWLKSVNLQIVKQNGFQARYSSSFPWFSTEASPDWATTTRTKRNWRWLNFLLSGKFSRCAFEINKDLTRWWTSPGRSSQCTNSASSGRFHSWRWSHSTCSSLYQCTRETTLGNTCWHVKISTGICFQGRGNSDDVVSEHPNEHNDFIVSTSSENSSKQNQNTFLNRLAILNKCEHFGYLWIILPLKFFESSKLQDIYSWTSIHANKLCLKKRYICIPQSLRKLLIIWSVIF